MDFLRCRCLHLYPKQNARDDIHHRLILTRENKCKTLTCVFYPFFNLCEFVEYIHWLTCETFAAKQHINCPESWVEVVTNSAMPTKFHRRRFLLNSGGGLSVAKTLLPLKFPASNGALCLEISAFFSSRVGEFLASFRNGFRWCESRLRREQFGSRNVHKNTTTVLDPCVL